MPIIVHDCPRFFEGNRNLRPFEDICFRFMFPDEHHTYKYAAKECDRNVGTLVLVKNSILSEFLFNHLVHEYHFYGKVYIGLNDMENEGSFTWF